MPEYYELLDRRNDIDEPKCTPEEQAGPDATECPACQRKTVHQHTHLCQVPGCKLGEYLEDTSRRDLWLAMPEKMDAIRTGVKAGTIPDVVAATSSGVLSAENSRAQAMSATPNLDKVLRYKLCFVGRGCDLLPVEPGAIYAADQVWVRLSHAEHAHRLDVESDVQAARAEGYASGKREAERERDEARCQAEENSQAALELARLLELHIEIATDDGDTDANQDEMNKLLGDE